MEDTKQVQIVAAEWNDNQRRYAGKASAMYGNRRRLEKEFDGATQDERDAAGVPDVSILTLIDAWGGEVYEQDDPEGYAARWAKFRAIIGGFAALIESKDDELLEITDYDGGTDRWHLTIRNNTGIDVVPLPTAVGGNFFLGLPPLKQPPEADSSRLNEDAASRYM